MKQIAILLVLSPDMNKVDADELLQRTMIEFGDDTIVQHQMKEFESENGGVVIYQP